MPHAAPARQPDMRFILHADDCGLTRQVSQDIFDCLAHGPLNSVSVIMGGTHTAASLQQLARMPHVRTCLHLNILEGRCTAPVQQVRPLTDESGIFRYGLGQILVRLATGTGTGKKKLLSAIRTELEAQADAFAAGFPQFALRGGLHLDGHLHIHSIPALRQTMAEFMRERRPAYVRLPKEPAHLAPLPGLPLLVGLARRALLAHWSKGLEALLDKTGIAHNTYLCGLVSGGNLTAARAAASLAAIRRRQQDGALVEIMCHPGGISTTETAAETAADRAERNAASVRHSRFYTSPARNVEKSMLLDKSLRRVLACYGTVQTFS